MFNIEEELKKLPDSPGVYQMKNAFGEIIYVGKAKNLKKRVRQYFQSKNHIPKIQAMIKNIYEFEYIITDNEVEALILEANYIKKYRPKYNTLLRDDKQYPYIKISVQERYPRIYKVREVKKDGAKYFGPYPSAYAVNEIIDIIGNLYKLRKCSLKLDGTKKSQRPCVYYHINRCTAPCSGNVDIKEYSQEVNKATALLTGSEGIIKSLNEKMIEASENMEYEEAAKYRDQIKALEVISEKQKVVSQAGIDQDVIGSAIGIDEACIQIFFIRNGKIIGSEHYLLTNIENETREQIISSFLTQFYTGTVYIPKEIYIETKIEDMEVFEKLLSQKRGNKVTLKVPVKGEKSMLIKMIKKNALEILEKGSRRIKKNIDEGMEAIKELSNVLNLDKTPERIEAYDISNIQGVESVGSMVVFENGIPNKSNYRRFKIKTVEGPNDYKSLEEVLERRINRGLGDGKQGFNKMPDLILIDGGKGQTNIAEEVISNFGLSIPVCGMIKDDKHTTKGLIYKNKEIELRKTDIVYKLIYRIQEEAHRFAIEYHRNLRDKTLFKSELDNIKNIGEKRKINLLKKFGSIENIKTKSINDLLSVPGMNTVAAESVYNYFHKEKN
ncbi:MAG TPA: excinuclease ABC subunit UvrC [Sedimentibacter sp.]|jgi:excinuclease ABC subunit C|nr:excinuclease ABC subunit UvrC [Tissierellia bacterium]HAS92667.1 excinuclease ABC subunit C [Clostridiales bacterium]HOA20725.1 excinuclease ABC subunit UvrC [Sedimentibacter sp.]HOG63666.1 excinuclease ABC subunit UvrC [Sedimentibacter sp.]HPB80238.1 excinuclease ABC subunit UvrC [Sedimentibacter sp.]